MSDATLDFWSLFFNTDETSSGATSPEFTDFVYPETWKVGDKVDAETLNRRIRDQNKILLRRPLLVATRQDDWTLATSPGHALVWQTVEVDDDGMNVAGTPTDTFVAQRNGVYRAWVSVLFQSNGNDSGINVHLSVGTDTDAGERWTSQSKMSSVAGRYQYKNITGTLMVSI